MLTRLGTPADQNLLCISSHLVVGYQSGWVLSDGHMLLHSTPSTAEKPVTTCSLCATQALWHGMRSSSQVNIHTMPSNQAMPRLQRKPWRKQRKTLQGTSHLLQVIQ